MTRGVVCIAVLACAALARADSFHLLPASVVSHSVNLVSDGEVVPGLPYDQQVGVQSSAGQAFGDYQLNDSSFAISLQQVSNGIGFSGRSTGDIRFSVADNSEFLFQSVLGGVGAVAWSGLVDLFDVTAGRSIASLSGSSNTGRAPGVDTQFGLLESGHSYLLRYDLQSLATSDVPLANRGSGYPQYPHDANMAFGNILLSTDSPPVVPLPGAVWAGLALMGTIGTVRLMRRRAAGTGAL